jgi:predicted nuclease of predicted toxin-antitoxin system
MKFKLDENLPLQIATAIQARTHDIETAGEKGLSGRADADIWQAAQPEGRILITQDSIFRILASSSRVLTTGACSSACNRLAGET